MNLRFHEYKDRQPVLLLYHGTQQEIDELLVALRSLADGTASFVEIHKLKGMSPENEIEFTAKVDAKRTGVHKTGKKGFECCLSAEQWEWLAELAYPLRKPWEGGHQYLNSDGEIEWIISSGLGW